MNERIEESSQVIAIVSHPGIDVGSIAQRLDLHGRGELTWKRLPPVHMLGRNTEDEEITYDYLLGRTDKGRKHYPAGVLVLVDANELVRQLYLVSQLIDLRLPVAIALINVENAMQQGTSIDTPKMASLFGVPVLGIDDGSETGWISQLEEALVPSVKAANNTKPVHWRPSVGLANAYHHIDKSWIYKHLKLHTGARLIEGLRLVGIAKSVEEYAAHPAYNELVELVQEARHMLEEKNENWAMAEIMQRTNWINQIIAASTTKEVVDKPASKTGWRQIIGSIFSR